MFLSTNLDVRKAGDALWCLLAPLVYIGRYRAVVVPVGFRTDFATVPRLLWVAFPQSGRWDRAAVVHDYLIEHGLATGAVPITSGQVDAEFRHALALCDVGLVSRWLMWAGVRWAALLNPVRRAGWWRTLPLLLAVTGSALAPLAGVVLLVTRLL